MVSEAVAVKGIPQHPMVLILVVMEDGLRVKGSAFTFKPSAVLILVVMEDGLRVDVKQNPKTNKLFLS